MTSLHRQSTHESVHKKQIYYYIYLFKHEEPKKEPEIHKIMNLNMDTQF